MQEIKVTQQPPIATKLQPAIGYSPLKRFVDITVAFGLLLLFSPLMLLIALLIAWQSPGPVIYKQERIGKNGRPFTMLKFRSMRVHNNTTIHRDHVQRLIRGNVSPQDLGTQSLKIKGDERIFPVGQLIRSLSLDELPQFINVLRGDMSLVGPRPPMPYEYELFKDWHKQRQAVLPGITGLWQVIARNEVRFDDMVRLDLEYIDAMNLWLDLSIMIRTPLVMLNGKGGG